MFCKKILKHMLEIRLLASRLKEEWIKQYLGLLKNIKKKLYSIWYSNICSPEQGLHLFLNNSIFFQPLGELSGSLMYTRLQTRLNPVPESLNSPDSAAPGSASGIGRPPAKDDPIRVYNRELAVSSSTVSVWNYFSSAVCLLIYFT